MTKSTPSNFSQLKDFLSYLATVKGDLSNITAPPFVLSPKSVTEIPAAWAERHELFLAPASEPDPRRRALLVLKNFLCSLKRQVYSAASASASPENHRDGDDGDDGGAKKPLNAFLGELFLGTFPARDGSTTQLVAEQVSHHPPVTACHTYNAAHGLSSAGYVAQETGFSATSGVTVKQVGHAVVRDAAHGESHLMTLPMLCVRGLATGRPYPELEGTCYVASSSGYLATVRFEGKGRLGIGGERNGVRAEVRRVREGDESGVLYEVTGQWNGRLQVRDCTGGDAGEEFDVDDVGLTELRVRAVEEQSPWESRRAWVEVIRGIETGDMAAISEAKNRLEEAQRVFRAAEEEAGVEWPRVFFQQSDDSQEFRLLAGAIPDASIRDLDVRRTAGVWKFIGVEPAETLLAEDVFHRSLEPTGQTGQQDKQGQEE
ncbi:hypothetical protein F5Y15DRAFT_409516 [Xylariaceae sp. FL0016]|nr:hypothetical protein F5Y15DRAFT_409516 [Xylariaceae sp. FL0016]